MKKERFPQIDLSWEWNDKMNKIYKKMQEQQKELRKQIGKYTIKQERETKMTKKWKVYPPEGNYGNFASTLHRYLAENKFDHTLSIAPQRDGIANNMKSFYILCGTDLHFIKKEEFPKLLDNLKSAGERLTKINRDIRNTKKIWKGSVTIEI